MPARSTTRARSFVTDKCLILSTFTGDEGKLEMLEVITIPKIDRSNPVCGTLEIILSRGSGPCFHDLFPNRSTRQFCMDICRCGKEPGKR